MGSRLPTIPAITSPTAVWADFPASASSAGEARRFVGTTLLGWDLERLTDAATLLVSELVANAVLHAGTSIRVLVRHGEDRVRFEVHDGNSRVPARKYYSSLSTTGRGLLLVERLSSDWGVESEGSGKHVWFELDRAGTTPEPTAASFLVGVDSFDEVVHLDFDTPQDFSDEPGGGSGPRALASAGAW